jgi:hypothetical protein
LPELRGRRAALVAFLEREGGDLAVHAGGRSLLEHLRETAAIIERWGAPEWVVLAALLHSAYGRSLPAGAGRAPVRPLVAEARRAEVAALAGERAERLAWLFRVVPRRPLLAGTLLWARPVAGERGGAGGRGQSPSREELEALVLLHIANLAEQARGLGGGPGRWVARAGDLGRLLSAPPAAVERLVGCGVGEEDEEAARSAYGGGSPAGLAFAAAALPVVGEPCLWLAWQELRAGRIEPAAAWGRIGGERLVSLGVAWDKRLEFEEWLELASGLAEPEKVPSVASAASAAEVDVEDPRALLSALRGERGAVARVAGPGQGNTTSGSERFGRYVESLTSRDQLGREYPGLGGGPFFSPDQFPLARWLEEEFEIVRQEIEGLDGAAFHREAERIPREGDWDVAFLFERGRRRKDVCDALPVTAAALERLGAMTTLTGLAYVSRMRAGTAIAPHRGPTNLRVRCHLAVAVPDGDCGLRVGGTVRRWEQGHCLVFDDYAEHEAWNRAASDRIVLIVDLWHPGLSAVEVDLLKGLHGYALGHAVRLGRYWAANAEAAAAARRAGDD